MFEQWKDKRVKVLFVDGGLQNGEPRRYTGTITGEDENMLHIRTENGQDVAIGKSFVIKVVPAGVTS